MGLFSGVESFFKDTGSSILDIGAGIISITLGSLIHYLYIFGVYVLNSLKSKEHLSDCLIKVLEDLDLFLSDVDLSRVRIIDNAIGLFGWGLTNKYTIYISESFNETGKLDYLLHELKHVEQYQDLGYAEFVATYDFQVVRYGYTNAPLEKAATKFEDDNQDTVLKIYNADCTPVTSPNSPAFKQMVIDEDWTMLLDLI